LQLGKLPAIGCNVSAGNKSRTEKVSVVLAASTGANQGPVAGQSRRYR